MKTNLLAAIAFATLCGVLCAEVPQGIEIIGVAPAEGRDHLKVVHVRIRLVNHFDIPLHYLGSGKNGVVVATETRIKDKWISSSTVITGLWEDYELKPGETLEVTVPVLPPIYDHQGSPQLNECPTRFRFDCSRTKYGNCDVSLYSDQHDPFLAKQPSDPTSQNVTPPADAGGRPSVAKDN